MLPTLELFSTEQETDLLTTLLQLRLDMLVRLQGENIFFLENIFIVPKKSSVLNYHVSTIKYHTQ